MDIQDYVTAKERLTLFIPKKYTLWRRLINQFKNKKRREQLIAEASKC